MGIYDAQGNELDIGGAEYSLGLDAQDGKLCLYKDGEKSGDGVEIQAHVPTYELKVNPIDGLLYLYRDGVRIGTGIDIGQEPGVDVSSIVSYLQQLTLDALSYVDSLGSDYVSYVVLTDCHMAANISKKSGAAVAVMMGTGLFDKYINLGDLIGGGSQSQFNTAEENGFFYGLDDGQMLFAIGNHDAEGSDAVINRDAWDTLVFDKMPEGCTFDPLGEHKSYYYYDNDEYKLRIIVDDAFANAQKNAFLESAASLPDGWHYFRIGHYSRNSTSLAQKCQFERPPYLGSICGHAHQDKADHFLGYLWEVTLNSDDGGSMDPSYSRPTGTAEENAITTVSINPQTGDVRFFRIGTIGPNLPEQTEVVDGKYGYTQSMTPPAVFDGYRLGNGGDLSANANTQFHTEKIPLSAGKTWYFWRDDGTEIADASTVIQLGRWSGEQLSTWAGRNLCTQVQSSPYVYKITASGSGTIGQLVYPAGVNVSETMPTFE